MATVLYCDPGDLGREQRIYKGRILGSESPLEFTEGHALVENEDAAALLARRFGPIEFAGSHPNGDQYYFDDEDDGADESEDFDAEAFVDRTPMTDVIADIESGEYDNYLDSIEAAEAANSDRDGVANAIATRRE